MRKLDSLIYAVMGAEDATEQDSAIAALRAYVAGLDIGRLFEMYIQAGYDYVSLTHVNGLYQLTVGKMSWFTSNLAQTVELPQGRGKTILDAVRDLVRE
jgi:hypothetical protein